MGVANWIYSIEVIRNIKYERMVIAREIDDCISEVRNQLYQIGINEMFSVACKNKNRITQS